MHDCIKIKNQTKPNLSTEPVGYILTNTTNFPQVMCTQARYGNEVAESLIQMTFYCYRCPITAVIDTGSNVVNSTIVTEKIPFPMDTQNTLTMGDANDGEVYLKGLINGVPLTCGAVKTYCDIFIEDTVPFDLLLG